jgi:predicted O-methyltransferase YrrM
VELQTNLARALRRLRQRLYVLVHRRHRPKTIELETVAPHHPETGPPPILEEVCLPPYRDRSHDDFGPLLRIVSAVQPRVVLEFGTAHGNITANICQATNAHVYTINALPEQLRGSVVTFKELTREEIGSVYRRHGFAKRVTQIYCDTRQFEPGRYFAEPVVDLAIIDACHDTDFVLSDFYKALGVLRQGAVVLLHDTHPSMEGHLGGSYVACVKLRRRGFDIRHVKDTWWAVWTKP